MRKVHKKKMEIKAKFIKKHKVMFFILLVIGIVSFILAMPVFFKLVEFLGKRIPQKDIRLDYIIGFFWAVFLGSTILIWPVRSQDKRALLWIWLIKCFVMLGLMLFYEYYYQTDAFGYFSGAKHNISDWKRLELAGKSFPVVFLIWLHQHSLLNSFHVTKVSFGMVGLIGIYIFYRSVAAFLQKEKIWLLFFFALFPSIIFWSSILGKEPIILLLIAIYCYGVIKWFRTNSFVYLFCALLGVTFMSFFRSWMGPILVMPLFISTLIFPLKNVKIKIVAILILFFSLIFFVTQFTEHFNLKSSKDLTAQANVKSNNFASGGSAIREKEIKPVTKPIAEPTKDVPVKAARAKGEDGIRFKGVQDMIFYIPQGVFTVLFRPLPGEVNNAFGFLVGVEGTFLLLLFILAMKRLRWRKLFDPIILWAILLIVLWSIVYSFVGFNLGTVCRYRFQILPLFLGLLMYFIRNGKIVNYSKRKNQ